MTERLKGVLVAFDHDIRADDAEDIIKAIRLLRGVLSVAPVPTDPADHMNRELVRQEFRDRLWAVLYPERAKNVP